MADAQLNLSPEEINDQMDMMSGNFDLNEQFFEEEIEAYVEEEVVGDDVNLITEDEIQIDQSLLSGNNDGQQDEEDVQETQEEDQELSSTGPTHDTTNGDHDAYNPQLDQDESADGKCITQRLLLSHFSLKTATGCSQQESEGVTSGSGRYEDSENMKLWNKYTGQPVKPFSDEEMILFSKPFEMGWKRELVLRGTVSNSGKKIGDVYYFFPEKKVKLRSQVEMNLYSEYYISLGSHVKILTSQS